MLGLVWSAGLSAPSSIIRATMRILRIFSLVSPVESVTSRLHLSRLVVIFTVVVLAMAGAVTLLITGVWHSGFETKSFWDWMQLLLIPVSLVIIATFLQLTENRTDRRIAEERVQSDREIASDRAQQETLDSYLDSMGTLINSDGLNFPQTVQVMRARTATIIRSLGEQRRNALFDFLRNANLLGYAIMGDSRRIVPISQSSNGGRSPISLLRGADLSEIDLTRADLRLTDLTDTVLRGGLLTGALLWQANLTGAYLLEAEMTGADLNEANLTGAYLNGANLTGANLRASNLTGISMPTAILDQTNLRDANLTRSFLLGATGTTNLQLAESNTLVGATLPDGTVIENEEQWQAFKAKYGGGQ